MENREAKLREYARLLVEVGLNLQKGQTLVLSCPVESAFFARLCASAAYDAGCREVVMSWNDDVLKREKYLRAADEVFDEFPGWYAKFLTDYAEQGAANLVIIGGDPEAMRGVDPQRMLRASQAAEKPLERYTRLHRGNFVPWSAAAIPSPGWAKKMFPNCTEDEAMDKLWDAIFASVRVAGDGKAVERWRAHLQKLHARRDKLNALRFTSLHYRNALGTDLTVELPEGHIWVAGTTATVQGQVFVPNMPTEEIFTSPLRTGVNGVVYAALPLVVSGNIVEGFHFVLKDGKIVELHADRGEEFLQAAVSLDEGASYLGEAALVPFDSAISNQNLLFYNTLFDENARCHLAFGTAFPMCLENGPGMTTEEMVAHGINHSIQHIDFMIGTADLSIVGTTHEGEQVPVFMDGNFAF